MQALDLNQTSIKVDWSAVFDALGDDTPNMVKVKAAHRYACGFPIAKICNSLGIPTKEMADWLVEPQFLTAVSVIQGNLSEYLGGRIAQRFVDAEEYAEWILGLRPLELTGVDRNIKTALLKEQGLMARALIAQFSKKLTAREGSTTIDITPPVMNVTPSAERVLRLRNPQIQAIEDANNNEEAPS